MAFHFKKTKEDIIKTEEDEEDFKKIKTFVDFVKRKYYLIKFVILVT